MMCKKKILITLLLFLLPAFVYATPSIRMSKLENPNDDWARYVFSIDPNGATDYDAFRFTLISADEGSSFPHSVFSNPTTFPLSELSEDQTGFGIDAFTSGYFFQNIESTPTKLSGTLNSAGFSGRFAQMVTCYYGCDLFEVTAEYFDGNGAVINAYTQSFTYIAPEPTASSIVLLGMSMFFTSSSSRRNRRSSEISSIEQFSPDRRQALQGR